MKLSLLKSVVAQPFDGLEEHALKVKECGWAFQQAVECHWTDKCHRFNEYHSEVDKLESDADAVKRKIRASIPKGKKMPVEAFLLFMYIKEQDKVLDSVEASLNWLSFRPGGNVAEELKKGVFDLVNAVVTPIDELSIMVSEAKKYFKNYSRQQHDLVRTIISNLRRYEHEADTLEDTLKLNIFSKEKDPAAMYHLLRLTELIGSIADHAENAGDMMGAMLKLQESQ
jgi:uncharacterized protein